MTRTMLAAAAIAMTLAPRAFAADLAVPHIYTKAPPMAVDPGYNWSGFYAGLNVGYGWGRSAATADFTDSRSGVLLSSSAGRFDLNGVTGGGQIGYNWQRDRFVFGVEGDIQASDINASADFGGFANARTDIDWFSTVRGRLGIAQGPWLLYGTGGVAFADISNRVDIGPVTLSNSDTQVGYAVGGGLEWAFAKNWSAKAEYLYLGFGDDTFSGGGNTVHVNNDIQTVRAGLNYKF